MRLSTLEIKGFKSFADKTTIHFNKDITGVVGPNGCGKSNIVDAIRWVLGETKSSNLRTERMENLVFNGTKKRKSSGMAEVSLTFDNTRNILPTEYSTVKVSRHYYRTGESEYRLNDIPCRLKDIHSLFLDTGISSDSYAIIELNMLSDLLNDKDNSRRKLFEQAAGISKYKIRKKETLNKLKNTQADLDRVQDLLFEIQNNLDQLEKQARKAQRFGKLKEQYKDFSVEMAIRALGSQKDSYDNITNQQNSEQDRRLGIDAEVKKLEADIEGRKSGVLEQEKALAELQRDFNTQLETLRKQENDRNLLTERVRFLKERQENLSREIKDSEERLIQFEKEKQSLDKKRAAEEEAMQHIQQQLESLNKDLQKVRDIHNEAKADLEEKREAWSAAGMEVASAEKTKEINEVRKAGYQKEIERIQTEESNRSAQLAELRNKESICLEKRDQARGKVDGLEKAEQAWAAELETNREALESARADLATVRRDLDAKRNEFRLTKNLVASLEGFPESIQFLRKHVAETKKAPLLSDVISCQDGWKSAIESYLGPWLNHYVVPDLATAHAAMDQLAAKQKGRAGFLVLKDLADVAQQGVSLPNGAAPAASVVETDSQYRPLVNTLLSKAVLLEDGTDEVPLLDSGMDVVVKSGRYVRTRHSIQGGSVGLFSGKRLGRVRNLAKLEKDITALETKEATADEALAKLERESADLRNRAVTQELKEAGRQLEEAAAALLTCRTRIEEIERQNGAGGDRLQDLKASIADCDSRNKEIDAQLIDQRSRAEELKQALEKGETDFQALSNQLGIATNNFNQQQILYHQQQSSVNSIDQELGFKQRRSDETVEQQKRNEQLLDSASKEQVVLSEKLDNLTETLKEAYANRDQNETVIREAEETFFAARGEVSEREDKLRQLQRSREQVGELLTTIKDQMNELKLQLNSIKERLMIEFGIPIEDILDKEPSMDLDQEVLEGKVVRLKKRLDNYGEINPMAVQAFEEMKTRFDFITEQKNDLEDAKSSLLDTIAEIDATAREKFMAAFDQVRGNFIETFRSLFRAEDDCDLILLDPENPLESKIDIMAKPKGKRPQVIDQLSGGEKTLTAMALLFGLYLLKPAPFCVLDEVDAPLDDTNINKFNAIIRKFSEESQFIIVTHNKRTMAKVDTIYGVTMQEAGISKVVPVDFANWN